MKVTKSLLENLYNKEKKSTRKIALELKVGKTTIEYYLKKFNIKRRTKSEANKIRLSREGNWIKGLSKERDTRVDKLSKKIKLAYEKKRKERFKQIEKKFGKKIKELIKEFYLDKKMSQETIAKEIGYDRRIVIDLMKEFKIPKRPKYKYIASLKGENHSMFGKTWKDIHGKEEADKRRKITSSRFRKLTIKRLENNEFPYFDTRIEKKMAEALLLRKIPFVKQFNVSHKFVCDFAIPFLKIVIECDGDYWHSNPKIYSEDKLTYNQKKNFQRDKFKDKFLAKQGWMVLRFFESDIKSDISKCVDQIEETIKLKIQELKKIKSPLDELMN